MFRSLDGVSRPEIHLIFMDVQRLSVSARAGLSSLASSASLHILAINMRFVLKTLTFLTGGLQMFAYE
jgi:hypothetical protein